MTYVVNDSCIKCKYMDCVEVCPVDLERQAQKADGTGANGAPGASSLASTDPIRSAFFRSAYTPHRGWMTSRGFSFWLLLLSSDGTRLGQAPPAGSAPKWASMKPAGRGPGRLRNDMAA
jgi:Fe-S-cluster-containing hydrogenase component 2